MQIVQIVAENFLSFERFELELADRGLLCIEGENADMGGSNGSGKSSIFEALIWCFFGVTSRGIKAGEVVRRNAKNEPVGNTSVIVQVDLDGTDLLVARHRDHKKYGNKMLLVANGQELTMGGDKETQQRLQQMLQIDYASFISAVMFPQGAAGFAGLSDAEQKAILERVLAVGRFADAQRVVKERITLLRQKEASIGNTIAQRAAVQISSRQSIEALREKSNQFLVSKQKMLEHLNTTYKAESAKTVPVDPTLPVRLLSLEDRILKINGVSLTETVQRLSRELVQVNRAEAQAKAAKTTYEQVLAAAAPQPVADPGVDCQEAQCRVQTLNKAVANTRASSIQCDNNITILTRDIDKANSATNCPQCQQPLPAAAREKVLQALQEKEAAERDRKTKLATDLQRFEKELTEAQVIAQKARDYFDYRKTVDAQEHSRNSLKAATAQLETETKNLADISARLQQAQIELNEFNTLCGERTELLQASRDEAKLVTEHANYLASLKQQLEQQENLPDPYGPLIDDAQQKLNKLSREIQFSSLIQRQLCEQIVKLEVWEEGFSNRGVKSLLFDTVTPFLSFQSSQYLHDLSGGTARMTFNTQKTLASGDLREKFNVEVDYSGGAANYDSISGGERRRVDISALFALGDLGASRSLVPIKLRLLDEPFENLDAVGSEQVASLLLNRIVPTAKTVVVIAHDESLKSLMPNRVMVRKKNGISSIVSGATKDVCN